MSVTDFQDLQEALLLVFTPLVYWFVVFLIAGVILEAITVAWFSMLQWMQKR
jgi:hypothetical protein